MTSAMTRPEDTIRGPRLNRGETDEDEMENGTPESGSLLASQSDDSPYFDEGSRPSTALGDTPESASKQPTGLKTLSPEETIELARHAVESGIQDTKRSLAGSEAVTDVVKPKLTIDLGHSHIARIPEPVVDLIKDEVERLSLSNNQLFHIPYRFAECSHLRYLNIRANNFREFPKGVYKLPLLEILDLSRNKIKELPNEISKLKSLRVLSVMQNRLIDLPVGLSEMHKLQIFKCVGNPLRKPLREILEETENETTPSGMTDNEKEVAATTKLKRFLMKTRQQTSTPEPEIIADTSDGTFDVKPVPTPIPSKRNLSGRFPVIPSTGDSSASSSRSPSISRAPPIPLKSHYRMASGQQGATYHMPGLQRPGVAPHSINERNRSNSEGIIQGSSVARSKRMGLITRKNTDLGTLDETRPYRNSHLRGLSHGSVLRPRQPAPPIATNDSTPQSPTSPREPRRPRDGWVNRMSSLPEHKGERGSDEPIIKSAKGILFALAQVHSHIDTLINVIKHDDTRRHSLELVFYNASSHVDQLNDALEKASNALCNDPESIASVTETVKRECETCIAAYIHVGTQLRNNVAKIVSNGDPRYVRSLMLTMFGSLVELRNACAILKVPLQTTNKRGSATKRLVGPSNPLPSVPDRSQLSLVTPTRDPAPPTRRLRSDTTIRHPQYPMTMTSNQTSISSPAFSTYARSRSSSRSNMINTSMPHSLATPRSGETFPPMPVPGAPRVNTLTGLDENEEERIFEKIFHQLTATYHAAYGALPLARRQFIRCLEAAQQSRDSEGIQILWNNLIRRCQFCLEVSDALGQRLSTMKIKEPGGGLRNQREFWQLCKSFMQSFVDLVNEMRELRSMQLLPPDVIILLRPVQKASREAGRLIEVSPWAYLADPDRHPPPSALYGPPLQTPHLQHHQTSVSTSALTNNPSFQFNMMSPPQSVTVPATPLSAALGPAAQATVPSTPASAYSDKFFEGDVFQRADSLLSSNQAPFFRR
ncbi:Leucine rich repeat 4 [Penicillium samsonianum]|uniref:Leucine rich repeat 4 n=1 Tax=Penicillium samsonianum TaxID=1882272 RepID=UPI0025477A40|nr:Leucine rich repeat 4 [Penicillium samsonianum]KAJ6123853.1 Leucine rich repeat 4 [Penicillium samsonianum]